MARQPRSRRSDSRLPDLSTTAVDNSVVDGLEILAWWGDVYSSRDQDIRGRHEEIGRRAEQALRESPDARGAMVLVERYGTGMASEFRVHTVGAGDFGDLAIQAEGPQMTASRDQPVTERYAVFIERDGPQTIVGGDELAEAAREAKETREREARYRELMALGDEATPSEKEERERLTEEAERRRDSGMVPFDNDDSPFDIRHPDGTPLSGPELVDFFQANMSLMLDHYRERMRRSRRDPLAPVINISSSTMLGRYDVSRRPFGLRFTPK